MTKKFKIFSEILPRALWIVMVILLYLGEHLSKSAPILEKSTLLFILGWFFTVTGFFLWMYVGFYMRKALFNKELIIDGPFKYVRHPMYIGIYIMLSGLGKLFFSWHWFGIMLIFLPIWYFVCKIEEKQMAKIHKEKYLEYKEIVGMFFPKHNKGNVKWKG
ncbi:MAG: isoprenylcysteine carboxylmethyltransferase family protein [Candidatus Cloacimonetes bacterium]|nr:isoprenylcysteine carboxylmethyltransferase family protein [Candidatus Cloacimonadota bacterium]